MQDVATVDPENLTPTVFAAVRSLLDDDSIVVDAQLPLIGGATVLNSMKLVELCLLLEDKAAELGFEFDWTSDAAMSRSRSMFRTAGTLAAEFERQSRPA